mmetsp:Transcript_8523/g.14665  ORF Transcript_8523/g.14665 Transcript_8523/m.14665 type:complete len:99 (+) Transcript_8523:296-592(+)
MEQWSPGAILAMVVTALKSGMGSMMSGRFRPLKAPLRPSERMDPQLPGALQDILVTGAQVMRVETLQTDHNILDQNPSCWMLVSPTGWANLPASRALQ